MKLWERKDPFFDKQPEKEFIKELEKPVHISMPASWGLRKANTEEIGFKEGIKLIKEFDDPKGLLNTAYKDFELFLNIAGISDGEYPIKTQYGETECFEAYSIRAEKEVCTITAADTEGIRRGLIFIEDEMLRRQGPFLPVKTISRKPFIKSRITRCFFSPTNRPPKNEEELGNDIDYYPEEYLNRLAHEGVNGIWIYTHFRDLLPSKIIPEYGRDYKRRIDKLNKTIDKCSKYGIKVYIFGVEPASTYRNDILLENHEDLLGNDWGENFRAFCTGTEKGAAYAEESTKTLFTLAPELAGLIVITVGESCSHCASEGMNINCPICKDKAPKEVLSEAVAALERGMHSVKPEAEFVSWPYGQRGWGKEAAIEAASCVPENTILMHNFEDLGEEEQLGRKRMAVDYWLSYVGPSEMFEKSAKAAKKIGRKMFAKLQVCCSHEVASVPYIPVPGILYKKYKAMRELGVEGSMQCWYFGNYPSIMGKAAGELSFEPFFEEEDMFLKHLAGIYWEENTHEAVSAWKYFENGYRNFPINVAFDWYGPMHDAPVWPLQLLPKNLPLAGTWLTYEAVGGDRIGECMTCGHELDEALTLCKMMSDSWKKGIEVISSMVTLKNNPFINEQINIAMALDCQFESGYNILHFYKLRELLGRQEGDANEILSIMKDIVKREIEISKNLFRLSVHDLRLGYHSEGEGFKYFPEKLQWRIGLLEKLLETEFKEVASRIENGLVPLEYYQGIDPGSKKYIAFDNIKQSEVRENFVFKDGDIDHKTTWSASYDCEYLYLNVHCKNMSESTTPDASKNEDKVLIWPEFRIMWPYPPIEINQKGEMDFHTILYYYSLFGEKEKIERNKWHVTVENLEDRWVTKIKVKREDIGMKDKMRPFRINLERRNKETSKWVFSEYISARLIFGNLNHEEYGWVVFDD